MSPEDRLLEAFVETPRLRFSGFRRTSSGPSLPGSATNGSRRCRPTGPSPLWHDGTSRRPRRSTPSGCSRGPRIAYRQAVADHWTSTAAGRHLAGRVKVSTAPEVALRRALHAARFRFRLHPGLAKGCTPDLVLPRYRVAVFVDGCFWHGRPVHGRRTPWAGPNAELWANKMERNRQRDERSTRLAQEAGWTVVRIREHVITADVGVAVETVRAASAPQDPRAPEEALPAPSGLNRRPC